MRPRYLTKSRYKLALECPTKLYYTGKTDIYYNSKLDDDFLLALAEGGYQVGELAKLYYPNGYNIETLDFEEALALTDELLNKDTVVIYEAAFRYKNLFIRADILVKKQNQIDLIEVKAKSFDPSTDQFIGRSGIRSEWKPYLEDAAFQKYVVNKAYPNLQVSAYLCLCDRSTKATVEGLNQLFLITKEGGRTKIKLTREVTEKTLGKDILTTQAVDEYVGMIWKEKTEFGTFEETIQIFSDHYQEDKILAPNIGVQCGKCEFLLERPNTNNSIKSGFHDCWRKTGLTDAQLQQNLILELWDFRKKNEFIRSGLYFLKDVIRDQLEPKTKSKKLPEPFLSRVDRQEWQINKCRDNDPNHFLDIVGLRREISSWKYPLHCIDFETTAVAIPFNKGRRPYEQMAFQFSHHIVHLDGRIEHKGEWLNMQRGTFPNFDFVRSLKQELAEDDGTIFRYAAHENTILNVIYRQLKDSDEQDKEELCSWIQTITKSSSSSSDTWEGARNMVDLRELVLHYYYHPLTKGSNSIKNVLPAILSCSDFLKAKYSQPIYGTKTLRSKNFRSHVWLIQNELGGFANPYKLLPPIHEQIPNDSFDSLLTGEDAELADGGAAMIAYARMQFSEMSDAERTNIQQALLRYCELDTFAMVMIIEAWQDWCK